MRANKAGCTSNLMKCPVVMSGTQREAVWTRTRMSVMTIEEILCGVTAYSSSVVIPTSVSCPRPKTETGNQSVQFCKPPPHTAMAQNGLFLCLRSIPIAPDREVRAVEPPPRTRPLVFWGVLRPVMSIVNLDSIDSDARMNHEKTTSWDHGPTSTMNP